MTTQHTPGPWFVEVLDDTSRFSLPRGPIYMVLATVKGLPSTVCTVEEYSEVPGFDAPRAADAKLLAAAPNLLEALQGLLNAHEFNIAYWHKEAMAAITKATGETK